MNENPTIHSSTYLCFVVDRLEHAEGSGLTYQAQNEQLFIQALDQSSKVKVLLGEVLTFSVVLYGLDTGEGRYAFANEKSDRPNCFGGPSETISSYFPNPDIPPYYFRTLHFVE